MAAKDWGSSTIQSFYNQAGGTEIVERFIGNIYQLPPAREVRRLGMLQNASAVTRPSTVAVEVARILGFRSHVSDLRKGKGRSGANGCDRTSGNTCCWDVLRSTFYKTCREDLLAEKESDADSKAQKPPLHFRSEERTAK